MAELKPTRISEEQRKELTTEADRKDARDRERYGDYDKTERKHVQRWFDEVDTMSQALNDASFEETFGARDRTMDKWTNRLVEKAGFTDAEVKGQNEGRE